MTEDKSELGSSKAEVQMEAVAIQFNCCHVCIHTVDMHAQCTSTIEALSVCIATSGNYINHSVEKLQL